MSNDKTAEEIKEEVMSWVRGADRYNQNLESHLEYAGNEIIKIMNDYSAQQLKEYKEVIRELLPFIEHEYGMQVDYYGSETLTTKSTLKKLDRARKLIDQTDSTK